MCKACHRVLAVLLVKSGTHIWTSEQICLVKRVTRKMSRETERMRACSSAQVVDSQPLVSFSMPLFRFVSWSSLVFTMDFRLRLGLGKGHTTKQYVAATAMRYETLHDAKPPD